MSSASCPSCDAPILAGANYCRVCGTPVDAPTVDAVQPTRDEDALDEAGSASPPGRETVPGRPWTATDAEEGAVLAAIAHLLALVTWLFGPLIIMLVAENPFVVRNAKNAVMWQVMLAIYSLLAGLLVIVLIGIPILLALWFLNLAFVIIATVKASEGEAWVYPLTPET